MPSHSVLGGQVESRKLDSSEGELPTVESQASYEESEKPEARENKLNEMSGTEWIKFTKSWFVHRPEPRGDQKIRHPASFPESLVRDFVLFFTKKGQKKELALSYQ